MAPHQTSDPNPQTEDSLTKIDCDEPKHVSLSIKNETTKESYDRHDSDKILGVSYFSAKMRRSGRFAIFLVCIAFLIIGRYSVPDNEIHGVEDKVIDALKFANDFINVKGNEHYRDFFQFLCSLMVDIVFLITFGYWVLRGTNARLPVTLAVFYVTRALVQKVWFSPFPDGYYWESPGVPSLVVPYGRGSDFFFSGHSGFLIICASEWHKLKMPKVRNFTICVALYTMLILLVYRIHYSIDVFTGVFFAEWCFTKVDLYKDNIDRFWTSSLMKLRSLIDVKHGHVKFISQEITSLSPRE